MSPSWYSEGQDVHREVESEGHEEKYRAVIDGGDPAMNRSAKGGARSSLHYAWAAAGDPPEPVARGKDNRTWLLAEGRHHA